MLWRYGTGTVSTDDPDTPEKEAGRWEVNAQFDGAVYDTSDNSGIRLARLEADGKVLPSTGFPCDRTRPVPCRGAVSKGRLSARGMTDGTHIVRVVTQDAAGNSGVAQRRVQIDATPPVVRLKRARGKSIVLAVSVAGQTIIATAAVRRRGAPVLPAGTAITDRRGRFSLRVPARPEPDLSPGLQRRRGRARRGPGRVGPRAGLEHGPRLTRAPRRRGRALQRPPAHPAGSGSPAAASS